MPVLLLVGSLRPVGGSCSTSPEGILCDDGQQVTHEAKCERAQSKEKAVV